MSGLISMPLLPICGAVSGASARDIAGGVAPMEWRRDVIDIEGLSTTAVFSLTDVDEGWYPF